MEWILAFAAGWVLAYFFYLRKQRDSEKLSEKLSPAARGFILQDPRESLGLTDIIRLFHEKIIDEHLDLLEGPYPFQRCPRCGSKRIRRYILGPDGKPDVIHAPTDPPIAGEAFHILCRTCGYRDQAVFQNQEETPD